MKIAPISADLLVKLALVALVVGGGVYVARRVWGSLPSLPGLPDVGAWVDSASNFVGDTAAAAGEQYNSANDWAREVHDEWRDGIGMGVDYSVRQVQTSLNPGSSQNLIYRGVNAVGGSVTGSKDFSLGSWIYDLVNPAPAAPVYSANPVQDIRRIDNALGY